MRSSVPTTSPLTCASRAPSRWVHVRNSKLLAESFNLTNRTNSRVLIGDDGFYNSAGQFVAYSTKVNGKMYPGQFQLNSQFLLPTSAYAPRQVQLSLRLNF